MSRKTGAFRAARRCYGHLAGVAGVELRKRLEAAGLLVLEGDAFRFTPAGRQWAEALGLDGDDRDAAPHARACLDGTEREWHVGGRLGRSLLDHLLAQNAAIPGSGRELQLADAERVAAVLALPQRPTNSVGRASGQAEEAACR